MVHRKTWIKIWKNYVGKIAVQMIQIQIRNLKTLNKTCSNSSMWESYCFYKKNFCLRIILKTWIRNLNWKFLFIMYNFVLGVLKSVGESGESGGIGPLSSLNSRRKNMVIKTMMDVMVMTTWLSWGEEGWRTSSRWRPTRHPAGTPLFHFYLLALTCCPLTRHDDLHAGSGFVMTVQKVYFAPVFAVLHSFLAQRPLHVKYLKYTQSTNIKP